MVSVVALGMAGFLNAQSSSVTVKAEVPFAFNVGGHEMLAGDYVVASPIGGAIEVKSDDRSDGAFHVWHAVSVAEASETGRLVFNKYPNGKCFLSQIWAAGETTGKQLPKSRQEREMVSSTLRAGMTPIKVIVFAQIVR